MNQHVKMILFGSAAGLVSALVWAGRSVSDRMR
jgi:hypothetical protein